MNGEFVFENISDGFYEITATAKNFGTVVRKVRVGGTNGDALDNVFYVQGLKQAKRLLKRYANTEVIFFLPNKPKTWKLIHLKNK